MVPKNHELARKLLKSNEKVSESQLQDKTQAEETGESSTSQASMLETEPMQRSITNFMATEENSEKLSPVEKIQGDMNRVILMLESLTIPEKNKTHKQQLSVNEEYYRNTICIKPFRSKSSRHYCLNPRRWLQSYLPPLSTVPAIPMKKKYASMT